MLTTPARKRCYIMAKQKITERTCRVEGAQTSVAFMLERNMFRHAAVIDRRVANYVCFLGCVGL